MTKDSIEYWLLHPVTKELMRALTIKREDISEAVLKGALFSSEDPARELYRAVGLVRLLDDILTTKVFENLDQPKEEKLI